MNITIEEWSGAHIDQCAEALADEPHTVFLDSNRPEHPDNNFSILCWNPKQTFQGDDQNLFDTLQDFLNNHAVEDLNSHLPFYGGLIGYISYEYGVKESNIKPELPSALPAYIMGYYTCGLIYDHKADQHFIFYQDHTDIALLEHSLKTEPKQYSPHPIEWIGNNTDAEYKEDVKHVIDLIQQGEVYQINVTRQFSAPRTDKFDSYGHYQILRETNPAPFSAYLNFDTFQILSCSPERFLKTKNNVIETKPIKGTIPDTQSSDILFNSVKDRAENIMIVDLLRNDLSKTCESHSVTVPKLCEIESFAGLHHLVSTVRGVLNKDKTAIDVLQACLPGGSITGAPKIAAMKHINRLETTPRGIYCGTIGYIGLNGTMDLNIVIRTMIATKDRLILNAGSGIVSDSNPEQELEETMNKIQKIFDSFQDNKEK